MDRAVPVLLAGALLLTSSCGTKHTGGIVEREVTYQYHGTTLKGYLAYSGTLNAQRPGVLVVHEWWGNNDYPRHRARMLAELGYVGFALDMFGDGKIADEPKSARALVSESMGNADEAKGRFEAAMGVLKHEPECDSTRIAAIGYCFGGGVVLTMARMGIPLAGVASFHGSLAARRRAEPGEIKGKILICTGAADANVPPDQVAAFKQEMDSARVDYSLFEYPGATHAFTNPAADSYARQFQMPIAYNEAADHQSWEELQRFLKRVFAD